MNASAEKEVILSSRDKGCGGRIDSVWRDRLSHGMSLFYCKQLCHLGSLLGERELLGLPYLYAVWLGQIGVFYACGLSGF